MQFHVFLFRPDPFQIRLLKPGEGPPASSRRAAYPDPTDPFQNFQNSNLFPIKEPTLQGLNLKVDYICNALPFNPLSFCSSALFHYLQSHSHIIKSNHSSHQKLRLHSPRDCLNVTVRSFLEVCIFRLTLSYLSSCTHWCKEPHSVPSYLSCNLAPVFTLW